MKISILICLKFLRKTKKYNKYYKMNIKFKKCIQLIVILQKKAMLYNI